MEKEVNSNTMLHLNSICIINTKSSRNKNYKFLIINIDKLYVYY